MTLTVKHATLTGAAANPDVLVDGPSWDANHSLTGAASPSQGGTGVVNNDASTWTISGSFAATITLTATTAVTFPTSGTLLVAPVANASLATMAAYTLKGNATGSAAVPTDIDISALTTKGSPAAGDYLLLSDQAAGGALKKAAVSTVGGGGVTSIAGNTGAFTLGAGLNNATNVLYAFPLPAAL